MSLPYTLPTRTSDDLNSASDVNALMANIIYLEDEIIDIQTNYLLTYVYPVGSTYEQLPDDTGAFSNDERPGDLFGGTWTAQFDDEGVFFRTEGDPYSEEATSRTNGFQSHQFQGHGHTTNAHTGDITCTGGGGSPSDNSLATVTTPRNLTGYGTVQFGLETRPINRQIRKWKRTA